MMSAVRGETRGTKEFYELKSQLKREIATLKQSNSELLNNCEKAKQSEVCQNIVEVPVAPNSEIIAVGMCGIALLWVVFWIFCVMQLNEARQRLCAFYECVRSHWVSSDVNPPEAIIRKFFGNEQAFAKRRARYTNPPQDGAFVADEPFRLHPSCIGDRVQGCRRRAGPELQEMAAMMMNSRGRGFRPVQDFELVRVEAVCPQNLFVGSFRDSMLQLSQMRCSLPAFSPSSLFDAEQFRIYYALSAHFFPQQQEVGLEHYPRFVYAFHGSSVEQVDSICQLGLASTRAKNEGSFGDGWYTSLNIDFAVRGNREDSRCRVNDTRDDAMYPVVMFCVGLQAAYPITRAEDYEGGECVFRNAPLKAGYDAHVGVVSGGPEGPQRSESLDYIQLVTASESQLIPVAVFWLRYRNL
jgi:hypothetical protein